MLQNSYRKLVDLFSTILAFKDVLFYSFDRVSFLYFSLLLAPFDSSLKSPRNLQGEKARLK